MPKSRNPTEPKPKMSSRPKAARPCAGKKKAEDLSPPGKFPFNREMATYLAHLPELLAREGAFVVIQDDVIAGICDDPEEGVSLGYRTFGAGGFMVHRINAVEPVLAIARPITN